MWNFYEKKKIKSFFNAKDNIRHYNKRRYVKCNGHNIFDLK